MRASCWKRILTRVALLTEGVDRNTCEVECKALGNESPSSRRAWIEILFDQLDRAGVPVALLTEGVDRNTLSAASAPHTSGRPPHGGRG